MLIQSDLERPLAMRTGLRRFVRWSDEQAALADLTLGWSSAGLIWNAGVSCAS